MISDLKPILIYLVDDDKTDQEVFMEALVKIHEAVEVCIFNSGEEIMSRLKGSAERPDVIYLDLYMPIMDGERCLELLRNEPTLNDVPIIIYSTEFDLDRVAQLFNLGANRYVRKPGSFAALTASLQATISTLKNNALGGNTLINITA